MSSLWSQWKNRSINHGRKTNNSIMGEELDEETVTGSTRRSLRGLLRFFRHETSQTLQNGGIETPRPNGALNSTNSLPSLSLHDAPALYFQDTETLDVPRQNGVSESTTPLPLRSMPRAVTFATPGPLPNNTSPTTAAPLRLPRASTFQTIVPDKPAKPLPSSTLPAPASTPSSPHPPLNEEHKTTNFSNNPAKQERVLKYSVKPIPPYQQGGRHLSINGSGNFPVSITQRAKSRLQDISQKKLAADHSRFQNTYRHQPIDPKNEIRVLKILAGKSTDNITCELSPINLIKSPCSPFTTRSYKALSYWWGERTDLSEHKIILRHASSSESTSPE